MRGILLAICSALLAAPSIAAEYNGVDIDGSGYDATAYSYDTGSYYQVQVEFDGDEAILYFANGTRTVTLDDEEIDDPHSISAYDYENSVLWELDVDGLD